MKLKTKLTLLIILFGCLTLVVAGLAAPQVFTLERYVISGGGGNIEAGSSHLSGTFGQALVGKISSGPLEICSGFWCGLDPRPLNEIYLPLVFRQSP